MAMTIPDATLSVTLSGTAVDTFDLSTPSSGFTIANPLSYTNGTGVANAGQVYTKSSTLAASATLDLDLAGSLTDIYGDTVTFTSIVAMVLRNTSTNDAVISLGGADSAGMANIFANVNDKLNVRPGGVFAVGATDATAYAVTATTADILRLTNVSGAEVVTYEIVILGRK